MATSTLSRLLNRIGPTDDMDSPLWALRIQPVLILVALALAETVLRNTHFRGALWGYAIGQLAMLCVMGFRIKTATLRNPPDPDAGIQQLHLTR
jgi:hypothetical protein